MRYRLLLLITVLICGSGVAAAHPGASTLSGTDSTSEVSLLADAYRLLAKADSNYAGHRVKAMKALQKACDLLGKDITAVAGSTRRQSVSDDQLRAAQRLIQRVRNIVADQNKKDVVACLDEAINEISLALQVN